MAQLPVDAQTDAPTWVGIDMAREEASMTAEQAMAAALAEWVDANRDMIEGGGSGSIEAGCSHILTALRDAGWAVVPMTATEAMIDAGGGVIDRAAWDLVPHVRTSLSEEAQRAWDAMLAAAEKGDG